MPGHGRRQPSSLQKSMLLALERRFVGALRSIVTSTVAAASPAATSSPEIPAPISAADLESLVLRNHVAGKFRRLLQSVVSETSVLSAAASHLILRSHPSSDPTSVPVPFSFDSLAEELRRGRFEPSAECVVLLPSRKKGESLVVPNLKLKVAVEALRLTLEAVFDKRFATFAYGGRGDSIGLGRHTAIRYLKNSVHNPSWWFRVALRREPFGPRHLRRLVSLLREKIEDPDLIQLVERLFESKAVAFELGGIQLGRGFPQESSLCLILVNIYFDALDRKIQEIRAEVHKKNPRLACLQENDDSLVYYKPIRLYAVRYFDEVLVVTSGSKLLIMDVKDQILKFLEGELELKVDKLATSIHSAVSEKMEFIGMEFQAVPPSVLHPPMSEKAIRAKKKYLKRKAAKALELKNARQTRRKKLGLKILNHLFKKVKRGHEFEFDFQIQNEVREVFKNWAAEVVEEYFKSRENCWHWHRMLTAGDFLSLNKIREQLPSDLVQSYDHFHKTVTKYLMPVKSCKVLEEEENLVEEGEEKVYAKQTVKDLTELKMKVTAPIELVRKMVKLAGFTNSMGRPRPIKLLICLDDADIIKWYAGVGRRWLDFFCCCRNFKMVKTVVSYHLRFSCFLTLAEKHECTKRQTISHYTKDLKVIDENGMQEVHFPTEREIKMMGDKNLSDPKPVDGVITLILVRLATSEPLLPCLTHFCGEKETILYRLRLLQNRLNVDPLNEKRWVPGMGFLHESLNKKCLPLCSQHASDLLMGRITLQDIDCFSFLDV